MEFDITAMKQRAKGIIRETKPSPWILGIFFMVLTLFYEGAVMVLSSMAAISGKWAFLGFVAIELVFVLFRSSCRWYALKLAREESTALSDGIGAWREQLFPALFLGIIKDICYVIGWGLLFVGFLFFFYWFRMAVFVVKDGENNPFMALRESKRLLKGHYMELIKLDLSNLGWHSLNIITLGVASVYVRPYMAIVYAEFYGYLKAQENLFG